MKKEIIQIEQDDMIDPFNELFYSLGDEIYEQRSKEFNALQDKLKKANSGEIRLSPKKRAEIVFELENNYVNMSGYEVFLNKVWDFLESMGNDKPGSDYNKKLALLIPAKHKSNKREIERIMHVLKQYKEREELKWRNGIDYDSIKQCLQGLKINDPVIERIVQILKPDYFMNALLRDLSDKDRQGAWQEGLEQAKPYNEAIKQLSMIVGQLKELQKGYLSLPISQLEYNIAFCRELVTLLETSKRDVLANMDLDANFLEKNIQKLGIWNDRIKKAVDTVNEYCHGGGCNKPCRKTHELAITKTSEILKILYPSLWKEDIKTISSRIKQRHYRQLS